MLSVGVDAWNLPGDHRGIGRYVRAILREWSALPERVSVTLIVPEWHTWTVRSRYRREVDGLPYRVVSRALHRHADLDVLWFPWNGCSWTNFTLPAVATLHDASCFVIPNYATDTQVIFRAAAERCRAIVTVSEFARAQLMQVLSIPPDRISAIRNGVVPPTLQPPRAEIDALRPYVLFVGTTERRKGIDTLCAAMQSVQAKHPELRLVLAGAKGDAEVDAQRLRVTELGWVDDATLECLYSRATVFAFPSRYEGFGLPPLEAMARAVPVVTTRAAAIPEAAGDAADYVDVDDVEGLANAILRICNNPQHAEELRERGLQRASEMTWHKTALATLAILERVASQHEPKHVDERPAHGSTVR